MWETKIGLMFCMENEKEYKILIAAGGTGGHLFPAIAIMQRLENLKEGKIDSLFVGTKDRIESKKVPELGYKFETIPIEGLTGLLKLKTLKLPILIYKSIKICRNLIKQFKPDVVLCTGAYISYPAGRAAIKEKIPLVLMESNVNPGKTIKMLSEKAELIITSFEETKRYLKSRREGNIKVLGNPIRKDILNLPDKKESLKKLCLEEEKRTVLIFGGSLGARKINEAMESILKNFPSNEIQFIWQTGKEYKREEIYNKNVLVKEFITDMSTVYAAADLVVSRAGATTLAEIAVSGKPSILIPLPTASNNEQEKNAKEFFKKGASVIIENDMVEEKLYKCINDIIKDECKMSEMGEAARSLAKPNATEDAAREILELIESKRLNY
jgi:UDP-N-acetylglucosamine--N-acetylmuramyl-(pentapeptide) pyrophosphoryl-undecaprenol N-acetylglucosamine transferase